MKVRMVSGIAGVDFSLSPGDETDRFSIKEAKRLIAAGQAVPVSEVKQERSVRQPVKEKRG